MVQICCSTLDHVRCLTRAVYRVGFHHEGTSGRTGHILVVVQLLPEKELIPILVVALKVVLIEKDLVKWVVNHRPDIQILYSIL